MKHIKAKSIEAIVYVTALKGEEFYSSKVYIHLDEVDKVKEDSEIILTNRMFEHWFYVKKLDTLSYNFSMLLKNLNIHEVSYN